MRWEKAANIASAIVALLTFISLIIGIHQFYEMQVSTRRNLELEASNLSIQMESLALEREMKAI